MGREVQRLNSPLIEARGLDLRDLMQENESDEEGTPNETRLVHVTTPLTEVSRYLLRSFSSYENDERRAVRGF
jgi:hypothetical protein